jgi:UDP-N-acetylglucosamine 2-epimerase
MNLQIVILYPNSDSGGREIIKQIKEYEVDPLVTAYKSLTQITYFSLIKHASALIGNSSSGMIESSSFKLPVVNIGKRQEGREHADNVLNVDHNKVDIKNAITTCLNDETFRTKVDGAVNPYGKGNTSTLIADKLATIAIDQTILQKKITY